MSEAVNGDEHASCPQTLRDMMAADGIEITVSTAPPLVQSPYGATGFQCPHGTTYWIEPTGDQIAAWAREGVE